MIFVKLYVSAYLCMVVCWNIFQEHYIVDVRSTHYPYYCDDMYPITLTSDIIYFSNLHCSIYTNIQI